MQTDINIERQLALSNKVVTDFQDELSLVKGHKIRPLPDLIGQINHYGKSSEPELVAGPGMFIIENSLVPISRSPNIDVEPNNVSFNLQPGHRLGRENSHNKVFFGKILAHAIDGDSPIAEEEVAVKPSDPQVCLLGELAMFQYMNALGLPTFQPVGYLLSGTGRHHLLTRFDQPVDTMDSVEWQELTVDEQLFQLGAAIDTAVMLHANMLFHGDLEFKNVGFGDTGDLIIVDPELMVSGAGLAEIYNTSNSEIDRDHAVLRLSQIMSKDFSDICRSTETFIYNNMPDGERPKTDPAKFKAQKHHIFMPYREKILSSDSPHTAVLIKAFDRMLHDRKVRAHS